MAKRPRPEDVIPFPCPPQAFTRGYRRGLAASVDLIDALDPGNECRHGRLAGDAGQTCDCWTAERAAIEAARVVSAAATVRANTKAAAA